MTHASDSTAQRNIERIIREELVRKYQLTECPTPELCIDSETDRKLVVQFDLFGENKDGIHIFEIHARLTKPLDAQKKKVMSDVLRMHAWKLLKEAEQGAPDIHLHMVFPADDQGQSAMSEFFNGDHWRGNLLVALGIEVEKVNLAKEDVKRLQAAQRAQAQGMKAKK